MNEVLKEKTENSDEPLLIVEDRSIFYIFGGLFSVFLFFFISLILFLVNMWWLKIVSMLFLWVSMDTGKDLFLFDKIVIYEKDILIIRYFLNDIKIDIKDIETISMEGEKMLLSALTIYTKKRNFLKLKKSFSIYALNIEDKYGIKKLLERLNQSKEQ